MKTRFTAVCCHFLFLLSGVAAAQTGPLVGTVTTGDAHLLYRPGDGEKDLRVIVVAPDGQVAATSDARSLAANDHVAKFHVTGLQPGVRYAYRIEDLSADTPVVLAGGGEELVFRTRLPAGRKSVVTAAVASCANQTSEPVWQRMATLSPDLLILAGDTPYVDVNNLDASRLKQRSFLETPFMRALLRTTPVAATWDDHDFGLNNGNGVNAADRREKTRRAFAEYRAHDQYGTGTAGVYHKVDLGAMEIFMLDPRWFSQTGPSSVDPSKKTCFGPEQWEWIKASLRASRATFKVLAFGAVWQDKKNGENDDMFTYWYERDALLDFVRDEAISGVVLLGGDIHVSRHLVHPQRVGYDLHDFITSPAHTSVISSLDVPHPSLEWSSRQPRQFMTLTADTRGDMPVLTGRFYLADGTLQREVRVPYSGLVPKVGQDTGNGLRAWWDFDGDLKNKSVLGERVDAVARNGASVVTDGGLRGGALSLLRAGSQYLEVPRSALDDNTAGFSVSMWCKASEFPSHGSSARHFLMESTPEEGGSLGYVISMGFRAADAPEKINLELFTCTLAPAGAASTAAPTMIEQGPFACEVDRSLFANRWAHTVLTSDGVTLRLYVDGTQVARHTLPVPGPAAESGGFVIGGHRAGAGRNFNGLLDEVALWTRALTAEEVADLHNGGSPEALPTSVSASDSDGDTMEDWWETLHGLDPSSAVDVSADDDLDSLPAWLERMAGTHPFHDDSGIIGYIRTIDGEENAPMIFRDIRSGNIMMHLRAEGSGNLVTWEPFLPGPEFSGEAVGAGIFFRVIPPPSPWFLRFSTSQSK
ncbi:MAG: alkaline phosphatase [Verrucomicrobiaceae bacterium]|nr:MAG: alkaline phosphatase [Verrucomicrobiaceae bacterium]